jgi:hypothetical protein
MLTGKRVVSVKEYVKEGFADGDAEDAGEAAKIKRRNSLILCAVCVTAVNSLTSSRSATRLQQF